MAVKWAVANGGWSSGATWNDGVVPTTDDDVYLNGHIINGGTGTGIKRLSANFITNGANADYGIVAGGHITIVLNNTTFDCGLVQKGNETLIVGSFGNQNNYFNIEGDVSNEDGYVIRFSGLLGLIITINGSVNMGGMYSIFASNTNLNMQYSLNLNCPQYHSSNNIAIISHANVELTATSFTLVGGVFENFNKGTGTVTTLTANVSEIIITSNLAVTTANITGKLSCRNNAILVATILNIFGQIEYKSTNNTLGVRITNLNIQNPDTFTWKDISEPRSNPFIIVTNAEMNNRQQYPSEDVVKQGVEYVWGEKVGTYQQPPESVVLKGFVYDTIIAEENDITTYNAVRYIYADYGTLHWFELKTTTTDIVTTPSQQSISIDGETVVADTDYVVEYNDACYQWDGSAWGSITTNNIGTVKTDIVTNPTETTLCAKKGTLDVPSTQAIVTAINQSTIATNVNTLLQRLSDGLTQRLGQSVTIPILQQILDAHLN